MSVRQLTRKSLAACLSAALLMLGAAATARAQFTGPGAGLSPTANLPQTPTVDPSLLSPVSVDQTISTGDVLNVRIYAQPEFTPPVRVSLEGTIQLPLIGIVPVGGLSTARAGTLIEQRLIDAGMYKNPQVSVQIFESAGQFVTVSGEIHALIPVNGDRRLFEVLAAAGSLPITASRVITILRPGLDKPITVDLGSDPARSAQANIRILPRDTILVSRVGVVYVVGAFKVQGFIPLQQTSPLTLFQAVALSGGPGFEGEMKDLRIVRTVGLERKLITVDLGHIMKGTAPDPILQADDIIFLPTNALKGAIKSGGLGTITGIASILVFAFQTR